MTNGIAFGLGVGVGSFVTMVAFVAALWIALFWRRNR